MAFVLVPILPAHNLRYRKPFIARGKAEGAPSTIAACTSPATLSDGKAPLAKGFRTCCHPEGDVYYVHDEKRIVTSSDLRDPATADLILQASDVLRRKLYEKSRDRLPQSEVFLEIVFDEANGTQARYYWADHSTWSIFWLDDVPFVSLGLPALASVGEIKSRLTPEYWTHVEYHPMHLTVRLDAEDLLVGILAHGRVDNMTSPGSTFPFSATECGEYLKIFKQLRTSAGYRNAVIARIWNAVARARHINAYGLDSPRLDRLQGLEDFKKNQVQDDWKLKAYEILCFKLSLPVFTRLTSMWNGRVVYQRHWHVFFLDMRGDWQRVAGMGAVIWLGSSVVLASGTVNVPIVGAIASSGASIFVALALCHKHRDDILASGPDISRYIMSVENYYHGLRPLSLIYVLPHTLAIYAGILFNVALVWSFMQRFGVASQAFLLVAHLFTPILPIITSLAFFDRTLDAKITSATNYLLDWFQNPFRKPPPPSDDDENDKDE